VGQTALMSNREGMCNLDDVEIQEFADLRAYVSTNEIAIHFLDELEHIWRVWPKLSQLEGLLI